MFLLLFHVRLGCSVTRFGEISPLCAKRQISLEFLRANSIFGIVLILLWPRFYDNKQSFFVEIGQILKNNLVALLATYNPSNLFKSNVCNYFTLIFVMRLAQVKENFQDFFLASIEKILIE